MLCQNTLKFLLSEPDPGLNSPEYAGQVMSDDQSANVDAEEIWAYMVLMILMGINHLQHYYSHICIFYLYLLCWKLNNCSSMSMLNSVAYWTQVQQIVHHS